MRNPYAKPRAQGALPPSPYAVHNGLAIFRFGEGEPLLLMPYPHGLSVVGDPNPTRIITGLVGLGRQVITFDPPGAGRSTRPPRLDMPEMIDCTLETLSVCGIEGPVDMLGHSQGGVAALAFSLQHPELVRRLVLVCTSSGGPAFMKAPGAIWNRTHPDFWKFVLHCILFVALPTRGSEMSMNNLIFRDSYVDRRWFTPKHITRHDWLSRPRPRAAWGQKVARKIDYSSQLGEVQAPTLVIAGRFDPQMPPACAEELAHGIPHASLLTFELSGHYPFVEEPAAFWAAVGRFLSAARPDPEPIAPVLDEPVEPIAAR